MRICLIFNPQAGSADRIKDFLLQIPGGARCELRPISVEHGPARLAREALDDGVDRIVVAAGDGSLNGVVNGIAPDFGSVELAILPCGTGNDFARAVGVLEEDLVQAAETALGNRVETIDLLRMTSSDSVSYVVNVANGGLGGHVAVDLEGADKSRWGPIWHTG